MIERIVNKTGNVMNLALLLGAMTLICWMVGGAVAVLGTAEHSHHRQEMTEFLSLGLNLFGGRMRDCHGGRCLDDMS
ncbi:UNVERIFIED_ORG: hypothetical protein GGD59_003333 [Rhizobium esperanzae]